MGHVVEITEKITKKSTHLYLNGAFTEELATVLINKRREIKSLTVSVKDGTKVFLGKDIYSKLKKCHIDIKVRRNIKLMFVAYNPYSPLGYEFDDSDFKEKLLDGIDVPIINVLRYDYE